jgi:hypothetical protein
MATFCYQIGALESEISFRRRASRLRIAEITGFKPPPASTKYLVVADEKYNIGNAYLCSDPTTDAVYRVCPEYSSSFEFVNSNISAFKKTIEVASLWSSKYPSEAVYRNHKAVEELIRDIRKLDSDALASPSNHWSKILEHTRQTASDEGMEVWFRLE